MTRRAILELGMFYADFSCFQGFHVRSRRNLSIAGRHHSFPPPNSLARSTDFLHLLWGPHWISLSGVWMGGILEIFCVHQTLGGQFFAVKRKQEVERDY